MLMHAFSVCKKYAFKKELEKHEVLNPYLLNNKKDCNFKWEIMLQRKKEVFIMAQNFNHPRAVKLKIDNSAFCLW